jgi:hypothetical protein
MAERRLSWYRWEDPDPIHKDRWTAWTVSVYAPTYDRKYVSILLSMANGGGRCLTRYSSLDELRKRINIPEEGIERLELALTKAHLILIDVLKDMQLITDAKSGALLQTVERMLRERQNEPS